MREDITRRIRRQAKSHEPKFPQFARELHEAVDEIEALRSVVESLHRSHGDALKPYGWQRHSPADEAFNRALERVVYAADERS